MGILPGRMIFFFDSDVFWVPLTESETIISCPAEPGFKMPKYLIFSTKKAAERGILLGRTIFFLILMFSWSLYPNLKQLAPAWWDSPRGGLIYLKKTTKMAMQREQTQPPP